MSGLAHLQRDFIGVLFDGGPVDARMEIYRRGVLANLRGALAAAYPVVLRLVGADFFGEAARRYALAVPSTSGDLGEYGASFGDFLERYPHASSLAYLADVARVEWALHESHRAPEAPACDFAALAAVAPERQGAIRFHLHPAVRLLASPHAIVAIWEANQPGRDGTPARMEGPDHVLVRRVGPAASPVALDAREWTFLQSIHRGASLDEAGAALDDDAGEILAAALARLAAEGVATGFDVPP
jgi:hypothetical protein